MTDFEGISVVTGVSREQLNERQLVDYRSQREACLKWLLEMGKNPKKFVGYARGTVEPRAARMDQFYRFVWDEEGRYTSEITHDHADKWMRALAEEETSNAHKSCCQKAVKMLFKWRQYEYGLNEWDPDISFYASDSGNNPRDYLSRAERQKVREAALEYGSVPSYSDLSPEKRVNPRVVMASDGWSSFQATAILSAPDRIRHRRRNAGRLLLNHIY